MTSWRTIWQREQSNYNNYRPPYASFPPIRFLFTLSIWWSAFPASSCQITPSEVVPNKTFPTLPAPPNLTNLVDGLASNGLRSSCSWVKAGWGKLLWPPPLPVDLALAVFPCHLTTTDPAAHLHETLAGELENLLISRIDPKVEINKYRQAILASRVKI